MSDTGASLTSAFVALFGVLGTLFIIFKLLHAISWPWVWVLAPFWGAFAVAFYIVIVLAVASVIMGWKD